MYFKLFFFLISEINNEPKFMLLIVPLPPNLLKLTIYVIYLYLYTTDLVYIYIPTSNFTLKDTVSKQDIHMYTLESKDD